MQQNRVRRCQRHRCSRKSTRLSLLRPATSSPVDVVVDGTGDLPSWYEVSQLAVEAIGAAASELSRLAASEGQRPPNVRIDRARASFWFKSSLRPDGWNVPPIWDAIAGDYRTADGWIRLHTNAAHHREAALKALGLGPDATKPMVAEAVAQWPGRRARDGHCDGQGMRGRDAFARCLAGAPAGRGCRA